MRKMKKVLAVALATVMAFGTSIFVDSTVSSAEETVITDSTTESYQINSTGWFAENSFSNYYRLNGDSFEVNFDLTQNSKLNANYNSAVLLLTTDVNRRAEGYNEYLALRPDQHGWGDAYKNVKITNDWFTANAANGTKAITGEGYTDIPIGKDTDYAIWQDWRAKMEGANLKINVKRSGKAFTVTEILTPKDSTDKYDLVYSFEIDAAENMRMFFAVDSASVTFNSFDKITETTKDVITETITEAYQIKSGGFWNASCFSDYYQLNGREFDVDFDLTQNDKPTANWNSATMVFTTDANRATTDYSEYLVLRQDQYGWGNAYKNVKITNDWFTANAANGTKAITGEGYNGTDTDLAVWQDWRAKMEGANLKINVKRSGNAFTVTEILTPKDSTDKYDLVYSFEIDAAENMRMFFAVDTTTVTVNSYAKAMDISSYRGETYTAPTKEGKVFAGWYADAEFTTPIGEDVTTGTAYAKFVDADLLTTKCQIKANTTVESESSNLRLLLGVDSLKYKNVGFEVSCTKAEESTVSNYDLQTTTVYSRVNVTYGDNTSAKTASEIFGNKAAKYVLPYTILNIDKANFGTKFTVTPYWVTLDGTKVTGATRSDITITSGIQAS